VPSVSEKEKKCIEVRVGVKWGKKEECEERENSVLEDGT
jgi:hypothetical protein